MKILVAGAGAYPWFAPAWVRGLSSLGLETHFFDWTPFFLKGPLGRVEQGLMWGPGLQGLNGALRRTVRSLDPDVLLIHCGFPIQPETVAELTKECWVTSFHHDDPFGAFGWKPYFRLFRQTIPLYHSHHVIRQENVSEFQRLGVKRVKMLMTYYVPWLHHPRTNNPPAGLDLSLEVVFAGHLESDSRMEVMADLLRAGIPVRLFGSPEWNRNLPRSYRKRLPPIKPLLGDDYAFVLSNAKICLAFHSGANRDRYSYRVFEIPACGGFLLAQRTEVMRDLYKEGEEAEYFGSSQELIDKVRFYLRHEEARLRIAQRGHQRCLRSGYDVISRMKRWLADVREFLAGAGLMNP